MESNDYNITLRFDQGTLLLDHLPPQCRDKTWKWDERVSAYRCDAFRYPEVARSLKENAPTYTVDIQRWHPIRWAIANLSTLRQDQEEALESWIKLKRGVLVMPTGAGKTEVALHIMHRLTVPALVVAPVRDLMYQWHQRIKERLGYDAGIIGDNIFNKRPISVTTYDSAYIHMPSFGNEFALLIFDECHHLPGRVRSDIARMSMAPYRLGLTATPERADGREADLDSLIGPVVFRYSLSDAAGILAKYSVTRIPVYLSEEEQTRYDLCSRMIQQYMAERRKSDPDYSGIDLRLEWAKNPGARRVLQAVRLKESIEDRAKEKLRVLEDLFRLHQGQRVLVFTKTNIMAREVSTRFLIPCLLHHCRKKERKDILDGFRDGAYPAIVANQVLDEGVDLPDAKIAVVLGGLASVKQAKQRLGRILRKRGEACAILYEVVCEETKEVDRSRNRRKSDAYKRTRHLRYKGKRDIS